MNASNVILSRLFAVTFVAASAITALGCSVDGSSPPSLAPSAAAPSAASHFVEAGSESLAHGIARYTVEVDSGFTKVTLLDATGAQLGAIQSYGVPGGRHVAFSNAGTELDLEYQNGSISAWVNGQSRGSQSIDGTAVTSLASTRPLDLDDVSGNTSTLLAVASDPALQKSIADLRGGASPEMFGLSKCPPWVIVGCVATLGTGAGAAVCGYCLIAYV